MAQSPLINLLWNNQQMAKNTDCSFLFKIEGENGAEANEKTIHANKFILSSVSSYFEANFKDEWQRKKPIPVTTVDYTTFEMMIRAIYLGEMEVKSLEEALKLYEAIQFYQVEILIDLIQDKIQRFCYSNKETGISKLIEVADKFEDYRLKEFYRKYFVNNTRAILSDPDFLNLTPKFIINFYQHTELSANENDLLDALERYVKEKQISLSKIRPAIRAIRFFALPADKIENTSLISNEKKDFFLGKSKISVGRLSMNRHGRDVKSFFEKLSSKTQAEMQKKLSYESCWSCKEFHSMIECKKIRKKFPHVYGKIIQEDSWKPILEKYYHTNFKNYQEEDIITILNVFQNSAEKNGEFHYFLNIDKELYEIKYVF